MCQIQLPCPVTLIHTVERWSLYDVIRIKGLRICSNVSHILESEMVLLLASLPEVMIRSCETMVVKL